MDDTKFSPETPEAEELKRDFAKLRASLDSVKDKLGDNAHEVLDRLSSYLNSSSIGSRLDNIEDEISHLGSRLRDSGRDAATRLETEVSEKPLASIAIAFGIGLLAAGLLRRR
jgi:ElaB/YqjD/DUF883 family membrane-anchored ribosome-binding protein